ncbi:MAG: hypothetical protein K2X66_14805 [Cyanobacteria bacterium]|nr:hypothetical protein [Cyanobacteriota bacterium]
MPVSVKEIRLEFDIKGDLTLYHISQALEATSSQYRRMAKKDPILKKAIPDLIIEEIIMQSPLKTKLKVVGSQMFLLGSAYIYTHDILQNLSYDFRLFAGEETNAEKQFSDQELEDYRRIIKPITINQGSKFILAGKDDSKTVINIEIPWDKANIIENQIQKRKKIAELPTLHRYTEVLLYLDTAVNHLEKENVGDKGIIDYILPEKEIRLYFPDSEIKKSVLENPFQKAFIVTVEVETIHERPACYKIVELHKIIDR